jgi:RNA polymerase sigma-70 factor (ECF subfamily)
VTRFRSHWYDTVVPEPELRVLSTRAPGDWAGRHDELESLAMQARSGDAVAVRSFLVAVGPHLLRVTRRVLGSSHTEIEDATQESAVAMLDALSRYRGECTVVHLACRVALRTALKLRRREHAQKRGVPNALRVDPEEVAATVPAPDAAIDGRASAELVRELVATLPEPQSEALAMHFVLGFTVAEIAEAAGLPVETIRSRLRLAKAALRARLGEDPRFSAMTREVG